MSEPILSVNQASVSYMTPRGRVMAVRDVTLEVKSGEIIGIAGESGCGKSTLVALITGMLDRSRTEIRGEVIIEGTNLVDKSETEIRPLRWRTFSVVFQQSLNGLNPVMTIREQFSRLMHAHDVRDVAILQKRLDELFDLVSIPKRYQNAYPHELSGGMRQRIAILLALALEPRLVVMDEPTTALDVVVQASIVQELATLQARLGFGLLFVSHDLPLLSTVAHRVLIMYAGTVVEQGPTQVMMRMALHPYTQGLLLSFLPVRGSKQRIHGIEGYPPSLLTLPSGCTFHPRCAQRLSTCAVVPPRLVDIDGGRKVSCHLYDEEGKASHDAM